MESARNDARRWRGYDAPFAVFGEEVYCPHCGSHYPLEKLEAARPAGGGRKAARCPVCHARGYVPSKGGEA